MTSPFTFGKVDPNFTAAAPINPSLTYTYTVGQGTFNPAVMATNPLTDLLKAVIASKQPPLYLTISASGDIEVTFAGFDVDGVTRLEARFTPEYNISVNEYMLVNQLTVAFIAIHVAGNPDTLAKLKPIEYIRRHRLERHFTFKAA